MEEVLREKLKTLLRKEAYREGKITLSSGRESNYYFDARRVTLTPEGAYLAAKLLWEKIKETSATAVGGPTLGADPLLGALAFLAYEEGRKCTFFIVRKAPKEHGEKKLIEGPPLPAGAKAVILDDVLTTGASLLRAASAVRETGAEVIKALVLIDREEGGRASLEKEGIPVEALFCASTLLEAGHEEKKGDIK